MQQQGFSLTELMVTLALAGIVSLFAFDSVHQVIATSKNIEKKGDFFSVVNDIRRIAGRLDQCTRNFQGLSWAKDKLQIELPPPARLIRHAIPATATPRVLGPNDEVIAEVGQLRYTNTRIDSLTIVDLQYMPLMNILRAKLKLVASVDQRNDSGRHTQTREFPLMFSTTETPPAAAPGEVLILGCVGITD